MKGEIEYLDSIILKITLSQIQPNGPGGVEQGPAAGVTSRADYEIDRVDVTTMNQHIDAYMEH